MRVLPIAYVVAGCGLWLSASLGARTAMAPLPASNPFNQCRTCHVAAPGLKPLLGPNLFGVVGSRAGSRSGYAFSAAMKASGIVWNAQTLEAFIANPQQLVRGTKMTYLGEKDPARRREIVAYLTALK